MSGVHRSCAIFICAAFLLLVCAALPTTEAAGPLISPGPLDQAYDELEEYEASERVLMDIGGFDLGSVVVTVNSTFSDEEHIFNTGAGDTTTSGDGQFSYIGGDIPLKIKHTQDFGTLAFMIKQAVAGEISISVSGTLDGWDKYSNFTLRVATLSSSVVTLDKDYTGEFAPNLNEVQFFAFGFSGNISVSLSDPSAKVIASTKEECDGMYCEGKLQPTKPEKDGTYTLSVEGPRFDGDPSSLDYTFHYDTGSGGSVDGSSIGLFNIGSFVVSLGMVQVCIIFVLVGTIIGLAGFMFYRMRQKKLNKAGNIKIFVRQNPGCNKDAIQGEMMLPEQELDDLLRDLLMNKELFSTTNRKGEKFYPDEDSIKSKKRR